jgi:hypothetical protein
MVRYSNLEVATKNKEMRIPEDFRFYDISMDHVDPIEEIKYTSTSKFLNSSKFINFMSIYFRIKQK